MEDHGFINNPAYVSVESVEQMTETSIPIRKENTYDTLLRTNIYELPLPDGWTSAKAENGRTYYKCHTTRHTQWLHPSIPVGTVMPNGLPYGWDKGIHPETGKEYYICHLGRYNTWSPPTPRRREFYES